MHTMEERASSQPRVSPHHGYTYFLLYVNGVYLIKENRNVAWQGERDQERKRKKINTMSKERSSW